MDTLVDFSTLSLAQMQQLRDDTDRAISRRQNEAREMAFKEIREIATKHGLNLNDMIAPRAGQKSITAIYRDPGEPNNTWTGRGRRPQWLNERLAAGHELAEFSI